MSPSHLRDRSNEDTTASTNQKIAGARSEAVVLYKRPVVGRNLKQAVWVRNHAWPVAAAEGARAFAERAVPLCGVETAVAHEATYPARKGEYGSALSGLIDLGRNLSGMDYQKIVLLRNDLRGRVAALFQGVDLLLVPAQGIASPMTAQMAALGEDPEMLNALIRFTCPFDMTGSPTITLPCGFSPDGMPLAFQFVGRHLEEELLVRAGHAWQTATDWHRKHPVWMFA